MTNRKEQDSWKRWHILCVACIGLGAWGCAQDVKVCGQMNNVPGYKILLDDIHFNSGSTGDQEKSLMTLLNARLEGRISDLGDELQLVRCNGRVPRGKDSFPPLTMEGLVNRDVVLEVWGEIFPPSSGTHHVFLNYVMMPLSAETVSPFLQRSYRPKLGSTPDEIVAFLADLDELDAYAKAARAVRMLNLKGPAAYDNAKADLEAASSSLQPAFGTKPTASQKQLLAFLIKRKCEILRDARTNTSYKGPLRFVPDAVVQRECPAGGGQ